MPFFVFAVLFIPYFTVLISYFYDLHNLVAALTVEKELCYEIYQNSNIWNGHQNWVKHKEKV